MATKKKTAAASAPAGEIGSSGVQRQGGQVQDEFLKMLQGDRALNAYREMEANSPVIGAALLYIRQTLRRAPVDVVPAEEDTSSEGKEKAAFVKECLGDMSTSFAETLADILSFLSFGWSYCELVYKLRPDGAIGWRKWAPRSQFTRQRWEFDKTDGAVSGMWQVDPSTTKGTVFIPIEKALLFRAESQNGSPEGRSPLRAAFVPYYHWKRLLEIQGIGIERDLVGYPVYHVPGTDLADAQKKAELEKQVRGIRRAETEGMLLPSDVDEVTKAKMYELSLVTSGGARSFDIKATLMMLAIWQALPLMSDFMLLGQSGVGSQSLGTVKQDMFETAVAGWRLAVMEPINRYAIPRLFALNGWDNVKPPRIVFGEVAKPDLTAYAALLTAVVNAGGVLDADLQEFFHKAAGWPPPMHELKPPVPSDDPGATTQPGDGKKGNESGAGNEDAQDDVEVED